jgi:transposase-like protein
MPVLRYVHQLFNVDQCQAYIHALRWKERPLQCPRCQSHNVGPWGTYHYQPGLRRYRCKEKACKRTFNDLTGTLLDGSKRSLAHWILATFLLCLACSSRRIARELGVHIRTGYRWCWWLRNAALSYDPRSRGQADPHDFCAGGEPSYCLSPYCAMMLSMEATIGGASWP